MKARIRASISALERTSPLIGSPMRLLRSSDRCCLAASWAWARCSSSIASCKLREPTCCAPLGAMGAWSVPRIYERSKLIQ
jgi:hypothetical protein